jgi:hypothetical protein
LVDVPPSTSSRLKVLPTAFRSTWSRCGWSTIASVVMTESMVAMFGAHMPEPFAKPPMLQPSGCLKTACFGTLSVVITAVAAARPCSAALPRASTAALSPGSSLSIGSRSPIRPVEQTPTSIAPMPRIAASSSAVLWVS